MGLLHKAFFNEHKQFQKLGRHGQKYMLSLFLYNIINPIFSIFINAFIWRQTQDVMAVALFNLSWYSLSPVGFYLNGQLLRYWSVKKLFFVGTVLRSSLIALLIFFPTTQSFAIAIFGIGYGLTSGIFFSNKNLLTLELTNASNRIYFSSLDFISQTLSNIMIPLGIGAFLIFGARHNLYTTTHGYYIVGILMVLFSICLGSVIKKIQLKTPDVATIVLQNGSFEWNCARGITWLNGLISGLFMFLPIVIVLHYVGKEDMLGVIQSVAAVLSGVILYSVARILNTRYQLRIIIISCLALLLGSSFLAFSFSHNAIFVFIALITFAQQLLNAETNSLILNLIDRENTDHDHKYKYVFDLEMVLNIGRVSGLMFFFLYSKLFSPDFATRYTPLFFTLALLAIIILAKTIETREASSQTIKLTETYPTNSHNDL